MNIMVGGKFSTPPSGVIKTYIFLARHGMLNGFIKIKNGDESSFIAERTEAPR